MPLVPPVQKAIIQAIKPRRIAQGPQGIGCLRFRSDVDHKIGRQERAAVMPNQYLAPKRVALCSLEIPELQELLPGFGTVCVQRIKALEQQEQQQGQDHHDLACSPVAKTPRQLEYKLLHALPPSPSLAGHGSDHNGVLRSGITAGFLPRNIHPVLRALGGVQPTTDVVGSPAALP